MKHRAEDIPEGYKLEWRVDDDWTLGTPKEGAVCRDPKCQNPAIATLWRTYGLTRRPWCYCAEHLYGREIRDGKVMIDCLVEA